MLLFRKIIWGITKEHQMICNGTSVKGTCYDVTNDGDSAGDDIDGQFP